MKEKGDEGFGKEVAPSLTFWLKRAIFAIFFHLFSYDM